ncbi:MAG: FmdB family zinc ribbon protein [Bacteroidota bacterium]
MPPGSGTAIRPSWSPARRGEIVPIYEFFCASCQRRFEELCPMGTDCQRPCPSCGKPGRKMVSAFAFRSGGEGGSGGASGCSGCHGGSCASCGH